MARALAQTFTFYQSLHLWHLLTREASTASLVNSSSYSMSPIFSVIHSHVLTLMYSDWQLLFPIPPTRALRYKCTLSLNVLVSQSHPTWWCCHSHSCKIWLRCLPRNKYKSCVMCLCSLFYFLYHVTLPWPNSTGCLSLIVGWCDLKWLASTDKYSLLIHGIKTESFPKCIFEWKLKKPKKTRKKTKQENPQN